MQLKINNMEAIISKGDKVKVISLTDETADSKYLGKEGTVIDFNTNGLTGNTEDDPLIRVSFEEGTEEFWTEELQKV